MRFSFSTVVTAFLILGCALESKSSYGEPQSVFEIILENEKYKSFLIGNMILIFEDKENKATFQDVRSGKYDNLFYHSNINVPSWGKTASKIWVRIDFANRKTKTLPLLLENRYALIDYITIHSPKPDGSYSEFTLGDRISIETRPIKHRFPVFEMDIPPGNSTFYLCLETKGLMTLPLFLWSKNEFISFALGEYIFLGILMGFIIVMLLYNTFLYFSFKTPDYLTYISYLIAYIWSQFGTQGLGAYFFMEKNDNWFLNEGYLVAIQFNSICPMLFARAFLNFEKSRKVIQFILKLWVIPAIFALVVIVTDNYDIGVRLGEISTLSTMSLMIVLGVIRALQGYRPAIYYVIGWTPILISTILLALKIVGVVPTHPIVDWGQLVASAFEVVVLSLALAYRMNLIKSEARGEIQALNVQLKQHIDHVETIVEERTQTINTILNHVESGFLLLDRNKNIEPGFSKSCENLFGCAIGKDQELADVLKMAGQVRMTFEAAVEQIFADCLPEEVALRQIPRTHKVSDKVLAISGSVVRNIDSSVKSILITVLDETNLKRAEVIAKTNSTIIHIFKHSEAFRLFLRDFKDQIANMKRFVAAGENSELRMILHTLKGNSSSFLLEDLHATISNIENKTVVEPSDINQIDRQLENFLETNAANIQWVAKNLDDSYEVKIENFDNLFHKSFEFSTIESFRTWMTEWIYHMQTKPAQELLGPIRDSAYRIAKRLNRPILFELAGELTVINREHMVDILQNLIHLVRNSIDHGFTERTSDENIERKRIVRLSFFDDKKSIRIAVADNGSGINTEKLAECALKKGIISYDALKTMSYKDKLNLVFCEGLSTKDEKSLISGHGVGMTAIQRAVKKAGGRISVESEYGKGCTISIEIPKYSRYEAFLKNNLAA
ncbi:MAG: Hpt domain-containing protein [Oligoflexales bacterium]|nr:Hpt domain-containing protein [Oligoflexales bacterium]